VPITSAGDDRPYRPLLRLASPPPSSHGGALQVETLSPSLTLKPGP
jgi:hypothetical protein